MTVLSTYKAEAVGTEWRKETPKKAVLLISVGQEYHEGGKLLAAVEFVNRHFTSVDWMIADLLQRHNMQGAPDQKAATSIEAGREWAARTETIAAELKIPSKKRHWRGYLESPGFAPVLAEYHRLAKESDLFNQKLAMDVGGFVGRKLRRQEIRPDQVAAYREACVFYILEELAVYTIAGREEKFALVYPGNELHCAKAVRLGLVEGAPAGLEGCQAVALHLRRRNGRVAEKITETNGRARQQ